MLFFLTNVAALSVDDDAAEKVVLANICEPPSASRNVRNISLYDACRRRQFFKR